MTADSLSELGGREETDCVVSSQTITEADDPNGR